jgi:hypothetical protein
MNDEVKYGWACTDPDCNMTDPGPYTEGYADFLREKHEYEAHGIPAATIHVSVEADIFFQVADIWPDGDAPREITAETVKAAMEASGRKFRVLDEWNMLDDLHVEVFVTQKFTAKTDRAKVWE